MNEMKVVDSIQELMKVATLSIVHLEKLVYSTTKKITIYVSELNRAGSQDFFCILH